MADKRVTGTECREFMDRALVVGRRMAEEGKRQRDEIVARAFSRLWIGAPGALPADPGVPVHATADITPASRGVCEAKVAAVLESLSDDELAYLYAVALYEGRGLRYDACISRLRRVGWR